MAQVGFVKDVIYGGATLALFASAGWPQWKLAAVHVLSVPGMFLPLLPGDMRVLSYVLMAASYATLVVDAVGALTALCTLQACCADGHTAPAFAPTIHVCDPSAPQMNNRVVAITAATTLSIGALLSLSRAVACWRLYDGHDGSRVPAMVTYLSVRIYQFSWLAQEWVTLAFLLWLASSLLVLALLALNLSGGGDGAAAWYIALLAVAVDVGTAFAALSSALPSTLRAAFGVVQAAQTCVSAWLVMQALPASEEDADYEEAEDDDAPVAKVGIPAGLRVRRAALKL